MKLVCGARLENLLANTHQGTSVKGLIVSITWYLGSLKGSWGVIQVETVVF